jgi:hypothetical protein
MVSRLGDVAGGAPPSTMINLTSAMVLRPLLFRKVLVAFYYRTYNSFLMPIGLVIFVLSFVLIGITAGPSLAHHVRMQTVSLETIDLPPAAKRYASNGCVVARNRKLRIAPQELQRTIHPVSAASVPDDRSSLVG